MSNRDGGRRGDYSGNERRGRGRGGRGGWWVGGSGARGGGSRPQGWQDRRGFSGAQGWQDRDLGRPGPQGRQGGRESELPIVYSTNNPSIPSPSAQVTQVEDKIQKGLSSGVGLSSKDLQIGANFPCRPGYGTRGSKVTLWTNYFEIIPSQELVLYRYNVAVNPPATGKKLSQIIKLFLNLPEYGELRNDIVTDFKSTLVSRRQILNISCIAAIQYQAELEDQPRANAPSYQLRVQETGIFTVSELLNYLNSTDVNAPYADKLPVLQALNIFLSHYAKSSPTVATIGSSKSFSITQANRGHDLGDGLSALRGFFSSVRLATCRILVNVNVSHGAFYDAIPLDALIRKYGAGNKSKLQSFLKRVRVKVTHLAEKRNKAGESIPRVKTIYGLASKDDGHGLDHPPLVKSFGAGPKDVKFFLNDSVSPPGGKYISITEYFSTLHRRTTDENLPVVNVGNRESPNYLPAEVCGVLPGQNSQSKLNRAQTQKMIRFAVRKPWENANSITQEGLGTIGLSQQAKLKDPFVSVTPELITVNGRVLPEPQVRYPNNKVPPIRGGGWNMQAAKFNEGGTLRNWTYLVISTRGLLYPPVIADPESTIAKFHKALQGMGINVHAPTAGSAIEISGPDDIQIEAEFKRITSGQSPASLVLVILQDVDTRLYNRLKHTGDVKVGVHTVCVVGTKFAKQQAQYFANVALKLNLKLGGTNQLIESTKLGVISEDKTMVVGVDVTHPSPGSASNAPSIAGMVASVDRRLGQWPADLRVQESRKEMVSELGSMLKSRLHLWKSQGKHTAFPENILVYRDGVSEGQYAMVIETELPLLRTACDEIYPPSDRKNGLPKMTIIVVGKRHHTRFYPTTVHNADSHGNPICGTVVDRGVTEARNWDFFLQSHAAIQGTARPAHYFIVLDEIFTKRKVPNGFQNVADVLEDLTLNMCYLFGRATKSVSICPPAYYADIVCERARCYLAGLFDMATPSATPAPSVITEGEHPEASAEDVLIHARLKNSMFYI